MASLFLVLFFFFFLSSVSAAILGPTFQDLAILPATQSLSPLLTTQNLIVDSQASSFDFSFSLSNPSLYQSGGLLINFTLNSGAPVAITQNFSYVFSVAPSLSSFVISIGLFESPCTTAPNCNTTYTIDATRSTFPTSSENSYDVLIIVVCVLGVAFVVLISLTLLTFLKTKKLVRASEEIALTSGS